MNLKTKLAAEHQKIYQDLEEMLLAITKVKNQPDNNYLLGEVARLLSYVSDLLDNHFNTEERELFPALEPQDLVTRLISDHIDIRGKFTRLNSEYRKLKQLGEIESLDLTHTVLYPAYNLIASINHHAQREDSIFVTTPYLSRPAQQQSCQQKPSSLM